MRSVLIHDTIKIKYLNEGYIYKNYPPHLLSDKEMMEGFITDHLDEIMDDPDIIERYTKPVWLLDDNENVLATDEDLGLATEHFEITLEPYFMEKRFTGYYMDNYVKPMFKKFSTLDVNEMTDDEYMIFCCMWDIAEYVIQLFDEYDEGVKNGTIEKDIAKIFPDWLYSYMLGSTISDKSEIDDKHDLFVLLDKDNLYDEFTVDIAVACYKVSKKWLRKGNQINERPITCFGEPHVIKSLRLDNVI